MTAASDGCCEPVVCADPSSGQQSSSRYTVNAKSAAGTYVPVVEESLAPTTSIPFAGVTTSPPPPTRIRLAHLSTLLI